MDGIQLNETKIVLVEGMPGTRKSSVAQLIARQLSASGRRSYWCHEERPTHPVRLFYDRARHSDWASYRDEALTRWERYAWELYAGDEIAVLDAAVLQNHARVMLLYGCEWPPILELTRRIEAVLASICPIWIYLKPIDIERSFQNLATVRGQRLIDVWVSQQRQFPYASKTPAQGFDGFLSFWREFDELSDRVFEELTVAKLKQTVAATGWETRRQELLDFLGLPSPSGPVDLSLLNRFCGAYRPANDPSASVMSVAVKHDGLLITCPDPSIDVPRGPLGCYHEVRLLSTERNRFQVEAWPHEVEFKEDSGGAVVALRISVAEDGWEKNTEVFERLASG